ncbi:STAS domain-containing protein [Longispora sp. NPDC051575]|uniref:STAS domain-containing protein n=1 Tax=Longispora sp. NPDC051575 TaxID=3154943 RepID=UPI003441E3E1
MPVPATSQVYRVGVTVDVDGPLLPPVTSELDRVVDDILRLEPQELSLDLSACPSTDAAAIAFLLEVHRRALRAGSRLSLAHPSARLRRNLRLARLEHVFAITAPAKAPGPGHSAGGDLL